MFNLFDIDPVIILVSTNPLDPDNPLLKINRHHQPIIIALDIEDNPVSRYDAGRCVEGFTSAVLV